MGFMMDLQPSAGPALVVGGGEIAARKVRNLAEAEFEIVVVAPEVRDEVRIAPFVTVVEREFRDQDLQLRDFALVFACTNVREVNQRIGQLARRAGIAVVVTDAAGESTFFTPATLRQNNVAIAVSTGGASPATARRLREEIVRVLGPSWPWIVRAAARDRAGQDEQRSGPAGAAE
jgi:siroheme synthase-like protein